jgi:tetratricopeptide (TPR) repeat protein
MEEMSQINEMPKPTPKTSVLAILSLVFALIGIYFSPLLLPALIIGIIALVRIKNNRAALTGKGLAIAGIIISTVVIIILAVITAINISPLISEIYYNEDKSCYDYDKAIAEFTKAIESEPDCADAYYYRGSSYDKMGEYDKAIADYNKALEIRPDYAVAYYNRGQAYYKQKEYDKAIADWEKAIKLNPSYEKELRPKIEEAKQAKEK